MQENATARAVWFETTQWQKILGNAIYNISQSSD